MCLCVYVSMCVCVYVCVYSVLHVAGRRASSQRFRHVLHVLVCFAVCNLFAEVFLHFCNLFGKLLKFDPTLRSELLLHRAFEFLSCLLLVELFRRGRLNFFTFSTLRRATRLVLFIL